MQLQIEGNCFTLSKKFLPVTLFSKVKDNNF